MNEQNELVQALKGCVDLIEAWMNGIFKNAGITWEQPPPALKRAKEILETRQNG